MGQVNDSMYAQHLEDSGRLCPLHDNQYASVGRRVMMTSNECSCMSQDPAYRTQQLTDFVRINVELVRGQLACAGFGRNVQVTELAVNQIVDV